jgi:inhibitor of cysteine peptidase
MKKLFFFVAFIFAAIFFIRFLTPEDTWIKINNQWVKHGNPSSVAPPEDNSIKKFKSTEELQTFLEDNQQTSGGYGFGGGRGGGPLMLNSVSDTVASPVSGKMAVPEAGGSGVQEDYSKTNVQVEGVDEADIVKTDGKYIYSVSGKNLFLIDATPAENSNIVSKIEFKSTPQEIYINGNYLVVYGYNDQIYNENWYKSFKRQSPYTFFKVFDVSDKKNPRQVRDLDFEGSIFASRMIGDFVYLVTNYSQYGALDSIPYPRILNSETGVLASKAIPDIFYFDFPYDSFNFVSVSAINVENNSTEVKSSAYLLPQAQNVYVSEKNIYLTYTRYISEQELTAQVMREILYPKLSTSEKQRIDDIENAPAHVLSKSEKLQKITSLMQMYLSFLPEKDATDLQNQTQTRLKQKYQDLSRELEKTVIHKIAINGDKLEYKYFGEVTGSVLNQFSMDESAAGDFRIATTKNQTWSFLGDSVNNSKSYNNLYILNSSMQTVGKLEDLATDEKIYSVRFMQNRAYMVTFQQVDPLFVIDVSESRNPKVLGKLKVPGFSQYLHPYDDNTLIGFGKDTSTTESGGVMTEGLKLSLFDVSDVNNLREINSVTIGDRGANSVALYDHKAFLFSKDKNLLVIPVEVQDENTNQPIPVEKCIGGNCAVPQIYPPIEQKYFRGAYVFNVDKTGFKLKGKIDHYDGTSGGQYDWWGYGGYDTTVKRSLYIGDVLYTMSDKFVKANRISTLDEITNLQLIKEEKNDFKIVN